MPDRAVRRKPAVAMLAAAFAVIVTLIAVSWPAAARAEEPSGDIVTVLQPGENLVGWIAAEALVGDLFAAVPEIEAVWAWDAPGRRWRVASPRVPETFHSLRTLTPGMGLLIQLGGDHPVEWTRSAVPARGLVQLRPGPNLVAWAGPDDSEITWLSKGIGISLVSAGLPSSGATGWSLYDPADAATAETFPAINRGDALWVTSSRNINWLQPTGVLPKLEFPGGASRSFRDDARNALERTLEFYADLYAIQADFAYLTVYISKDREAYNAATGRSMSREDWEIAQAGPNFILIPILQNPVDASVPRHVLSHEYFHVLQLHSAFDDSGHPFLSGPAQMPTWLIEGSAERMAARHVDADGVGDWEWFYAHALRDVRSGSASLESSLSAYVWGAVAFELLAQRAGENAIIEFFRLLDGSPESFFAFWRAEFLEAFGVSAADFYAAFCRFRRGETTPDYDSDSPSCLDDDVRIISGALLDDDGTAISGATVRAEPLGAKRAFGDDALSMPQLARTDSQGRFTLRFADSGTGPIRLHIAIVEQPCAGWYATGYLSGWYAAGGLAGAPAAVPFDGGIADIQITVPSGTCRRIEGSVVSPDGAGLPGAHVVLSERSGASDWSRTASDGSFAFEASPRGRYQLEVEFGNGCRVVWFAGGDNVAAFGADAGYSRLDDLDGVRVVVPENVCRWSVRGRLVDSDGEGIAGGWVSLQGKMSFSGSTKRTRPDGSFSFVVPLPGEYQLSIPYTGCQPPPYYADDGSVTFDRSEAALLALGAEDVSDLVLRFPDGACNDR